MWFYGTVIDDTAEPDQEALLVVLLAAAAILEGRSTAGATQG